MPKSNFRALSFFFLCFSSFCFCHGQDSLRTLKSERYYYKGKTFRVNHFNKKGQITLTWENNSDASRRNTSNVSLFEYDSLSNHKVTTSYYSKIKDERIVILLREDGKPDGFTLISKRDSITERNYTERYNIQLPIKPGKYSMEELFKEKFVSTFDRITIHPCRMVLDSTETIRKFRTEYPDGTIYLENYTYDTLGNLLTTSNKFIQRNRISIDESSIIGNKVHSSYKTFKLPIEANELLSEQENISILNNKRQRIKEDFYTTVLPSGKKKRYKTIKYEYYGDALEKRTIRKGGKKYVLEIRRTYW